MYNGPYALEHQLIKVNNIQTWKQFLFECSLNNWTLSTSLLYEWKSGWLKYQELKYFGYLYPKNT